MQLVVNDETVIRLKDMSEEEFYEFCSVNEDYRIERILDPDRRQAHVYTTDGVRIVENPLRLEGERPVTGFVFDLGAFWDLSW